MTAIFQKKNADFRLEALYQYRGPGIRHQELSYEKGVFSNMKNVEVSVKPYFFDFSADFSETGA